MKKGTFILRLVLVISLLTLGAQFFIVFFTSGKIKDFIFNQELSNLRDAAVLFKEVARDDLRDVFAGNQRHFLARMPFRWGFRLSLIGLDGQPLDDSHLSPGLVEDTQDQPEVVEALVKGEGTAVRFSGIIEKVMVHYALSFWDAGRVAGIIRVSAPTDEIEAQFSEFLGYYYSLSFASLFLIFVGSLYYSRMITESINQLTSASESFTRGEAFSRPIPRGPEEFRILAQALNGMFTQLEDRFSVIQDQKDELEAILERMTEGVLVLDRRLLVRKANPAVKTLFRWKNGSVEGRSLLEICRSTELFSFAARLGDSQAGRDSALIAVTGTQLHLQVNGAVLGNPASGSGLLLVLNDVTPLKRIEEIRRDFVANVSHELKTPITNIKGYVETLQSGALDHPHKARQFLEVIGNHTERLNLIIDDLLTLSKLENQKDGDFPREWRSLEELICSALKIVEEKILRKGMEVIEDFPEMSVIVPVYPRFFEQALVNLLDNAVKFSPPKSRIFIHLKKLGSVARVVVQDQGEGIPEKDWERVFERFYRTEKGRSTEGTGLGLAIVKHIMLLHDGKVELSSDPKKGTAFTLTLPLDEPVRESDRPR